MNVEIMIDDKMLEKVLSDAVKSKANQYFEVQVKKTFSNINSETTEKVVKKVLSGIDKIIENIAKDYLDKILTTKSLKDRVEEAVYAELNKRIEIEKMYSFIKNQEIMEI